MGVRLGRRRRRRGPRRGQHRRRRRSQRSLRQTHATGLPQGRRGGRVQGDEIERHRQHGPGHIVAVRARARVSVTRDVRAAVRQRRRRGPAQQE